ncbi:MAG: Hpt domain-containing protein [Gammaproteobacteria bacterium]
MPGCADYLARLPGELQCLRELAGGYGEARDRPVLLELHQRLHKVTGTAGSFGCPDLTHASRQVEQKIKRWLEDADGAGYDAAACAALKQGVFALSETVPELQSALPVVAVEPAIPLACSAQKVPGLADDR